MAGRAVLAVSLTIGFYVLALSLIVALLAIPYFEITVLHRLSLRISVFCVAGAAIIAYSLLPTFERFRAPGERITARSHPRLFDELTMIARAVGQPMPEEIYLVQDVNAAVRQRGGVMGIGDRRVMLLGLPLLRILRVSELRAVLVHEFGHYRGHTQLGPWIFKTRQSLLRTVAHLSGYNATMVWPFAQYARLFLSITQDMWRQMEFEADALAAQVVGGRAMISGLRGVHGTAIAYGQYLKETTPVYGDRFTALSEPDENFFRFMSLPRVSDLIRKSLDEELKNPQLHPYDSHPPMGMRTAVLEKMPPGIDPSREPLAAVLLDPNAGTGTAAASAAAPPAGSRPWEDAGAAGEQFRWEEEVRRNFHILRSWTIGNMAELAPSLAKVGGRLGTRWVADETAAQAGRDLLIAALGTALLRSGWMVEETASGSPTLRKGETVIDPGQEVDRLVSGEVDAAAWRSKWTGLGAVSLRLDALRRAA
jgi:heat shock protein HtpX